MTLYAIADKPVEYQNAGSSVVMCGVSAGMLPVDMA